MAATVEELKELALLAREQGDDVLEAKALEMLIAQQQPTESNIQPQAQNEPAAQPVAQSEQATFEDQMMSIPGMKPLAELAAASNKSIFQALDFFGPDNINAVLKVFGSSQQVPTLAETLGSDGGFMDPGLARDAVQASGMLLPVAAGAAPVVGRNLATAKGAAQELLGLGAAKVEPVLQPIRSAAAAASNAVSDALPSKAKEAAKLPLYRQSGDVAAAGFKLDDAGRVINDAVQKKALKAGLDEGAVAMIASANKATKSRINDMVEVLEKGRSNLEFRNFNTPQKVVGEAINDRLSIIQKANKEAAKRLDSVAGSLKGKSVDVAPAVNSFLDNLEKQGIKFDPGTGALDFADSTIEGLTDAQNIITRVLKRLRNTSDPTQDAYRVHNAKKFLDEQVSYGKTQAGLSGKMEGIVKGLRHDLDGILDTNFSAYDRVNSIYSETRTVIDDLQSLVGGKVDLTSPNVDKALGVMSRKVLSNYASGTATEDLFDQLDTVARRYSTPLSGSVDDDLRKIVSAEAEIRKMFPTASKPNTFQGQIGTEVMRGARDAATGNKLGILSRVTEAAGKVFSKSDEEKIQALKDLLTK